MHKLMIAVLGALIAFPLVGDEAKKSEAKPKEQQEQQSSAAAATQDSPLVAAAKRANRGKPKSKIVITDESLKTGGQNARITTAAEQRPINVPPAARPTPEMLHAEKQAKQREAAAAQKAQKEKTAAGSTKKKSATDADVARLEGAVEGPEGVDQLPEAVWAEEPKPELVQPPPPQR